MNFASCFLIAGLLFVSVQALMTVPPTKIRALLWDIDGTLSDSFNLGFESTIEVMRRNGYPDVSEGDYHAGSRFSTPRRFAWHTMGDPDHPLGKQLGDEFDSLYVAKVTTGTTPLYDGIMHLIHTFQQEHPHVVFGALSNACGDYVRAVLAAHSLTSNFTIALGADEVPAPKPSPSGLQEIMRRCNLSPDECLFIGDSPSDGQAAAAAGMQSVGVCWGSHPRETVQPQFTHTVETVTELHHLLARLVDGLHDE